LTMVTSSWITANAKLLAAVTHATEPIGRAGVTGSFAVGQFGAAVEFAGTNGCILL
jgi:hypothetical protein